MPHKQFQAGAASFPTCARAANADAVLPRAGWRQFGAISAKGPITKRRSWALGCGSCKPSVSRISRPKAMRSRSSARGAFRTPLRRPRSRSKASSRDITSPAASAVSTIVMPLRYSGAVGSGHAIERHQTERARTRSPMSGNRRSAASNNASDESKPPGRLLPSATMTAPSRSRGSKAMPSTIRLARTISAAAGP